jgi:Xaa-Pro aminopeptidase
MRETDLIPRLSLAERDRRYKLVREKMASEGLDVLLLPANTSRWEQTMADSRYLTGIGGFATEVLTIFPAEGPVTAYVFNRANWWKQVQDWVEDVRDGRNRWAENAVARLRELGFKKGRLGLSGLSGLIRTPDGIVPHTTVELLREAFPEAELVNATGLMQEVRAIKSAEEISFMERSMEIVEQMIETMTEGAREGVSEKELYADMAHVMLRSGGELPTLFFLGSGPGATQSSFVPTSRVIQRGDRIVNEIEAKYGGYAAQAVSPMLLGEPDTAFRELMDISCACFNAILAAMKPGVTFGTLFDTYMKTVEDLGDGKYMWSHPMMHARGLGDDGPALMGDADVERFQKIQLASGMVFILKPRIRVTEGKDHASIGDTVVVTDDGARRLGSRKLELITVPS